MLSLADRLKNLKPSATMELDAKARAMIARGEDVINLTAGEPDFNPPNSVLLATCTAALTGKTKYTPAKGQASLLKEIADFFELQLGDESSEKNVMVTSGGKVACFWPLFATVNPGDEVIILAPYWTSYPAMVELCGGKPIIFDYKDLRAKDGQQYLLEKKITSKTKVIILNSPNNPAGYVFGSKDLAVLSEIFTDKNIWIISDEIYANLVYGDNRHVSIASVNEKLREKTIIINGASKAFAMTGYRIGFLWGNKEIITKMAQIQSQVIGCPCSISQEAAKTALQKAKPKIEVMRQAYEHRLETIIRPFFRKSSLKYIQPEGAFYLFFKLPDNFHNCTIFCQDLLEKEKLALVPGSAFGYPGWVRLSYSASEQNLKEGLNRLQKFLI